MKVLIYEARMRKNMSLRTLAEKTGISKTILNNIGNQKESVHFYSHLILLSNKSK